MKIGTITFQFAINYGAVIQAYALQKWLLLKGYQTEIINYCPINHSNKYDLSIKNKEKLFGKGLKNTYKALRYYLFDKKSFEIKKSKFEEFSKKYLVLSKKFVDPDQFQTVNSYDAIICGSDQIWNPEITDGFDQMYFGGNNIYEVPVISYAASLGTNSVLSNYYTKEQFKKYLCRVDSVGVREKQLQELMTENKMCDATVVCDPVFLISPDQYYSLCNDNNKYSKPYILIYQLERYNQTYTVAKAIADKYGYDIVELCGTPYNSLHGNRIIDDAGPEEFLSLIKNASFVVTNSFHGTAFSIIFQRPFNVVLSRNRNDRITSLLHQFGLENKIVREVPNFDSIDFEKIEESLYDIRNNSEQFLINALERTHSTKKYVAREEKCIAIRVKNEEILKEVSSGGICFAIAEHYIKNSGIVYGVVYCDNYRSVKYKRINSYDDIKEIIGSKYVKADIRSIFDNVKKDLNEGFEVCVVGLPCEIYSLGKYLDSNNINRDRLLTIDIICHGPGRNEYLYDYISYLEQKYHSKILKFSMRHKYLGWTPPCVYAEFENGRKYIEELAISDFGIAFYTSPSKCSFTCHFKGENHYSDFTVGDYWGCNHEDCIYNSMGVSVAIVHNSKKEHIIYSIDGIVYSDADYDSVMRGNPSYNEPLSNSENADKYLERYRSYGIHIAANNQLNLKRKLIRHLPINIRKSIFYK